MKRPEEKLEDHLGLFSSLSEQELAAAEERASHRFRSAPALAEAPSEQIVIRPVWRWRLGLVAAVAAAILVVIFVQTHGIDIHAVVESTHGSRKIEYGEVVQGTEGAGDTVVLSDGSRVEMRAGSELSLEGANDGVRIRLNKGDIIVNAAKQHGHLYVQTKDVMVSVVGTVFLVNAEKEGSRVAVIEGEVRIKQGDTETKLRPGEQVNTNPLVESQLLSQEILWSKNAEAHMALLQQAPVIPAEPKKEFELVSIRPSGPAPSGGGRGGAPPLPCSQLFLDLARDGSAILRVQVDPKRFVVSRTNLYTLITWAYGMNCDNSVRAGLISGGPGWIMSDEWDIQALIREGTPAYTARQFVAGNAPDLQEQLRSLLETRFKLVLRREMKDAPVYVLTLGKRPLNLTPDAGPFGLGALTGGIDENGLRYSKFMQVPTTNFARMLMLATDRAVLDRTNIKGDFTLNIEFAPFSGNGPSSRPSLFKALEDVGLKLEEVKVPLEGLVIDHVEKPSEN
jgi:uncharacterized protein (TIGR03435 family)